MTDTPAAPITPTDDASEEVRLREAYAIAVAELNRLRDKASVDDTAEQSTAKYSLHEVQGIGKYVIPRRTGWKPLLEVIHDPVPNIDFSANIYPAFDGILGQRFNSPYLLDPLDDNFMSYESLRDNLAAVRNFLMQTYYADTPNGMTPEKAKQSLAEIAAFVGDGLYNNWLYYGVVPNHNPTKPHIDLGHARRTGGEGAQYIYEKILEHQRHSSWLRPFEKVAELFGGKPKHDWMLPPARATHFNERYGKLLTEGGLPPGADMASIEVAAAEVAAIEARLSALYDSRAVSDVAGDLDALANHLIFTADTMDAGGVAQLSEPTRVRAVEIARDILRKLKFSLGDVSLLDGLRLKPTDDLTTFNAVHGVATVYERLLAWARGNHDAGIMQHPAILAANRAIGQVGYLAKREAHRMATLAGNSLLAERLSTQLATLSARYGMPEGARFGDLLDTIDSGINTIITRIQQVGVSGGEIGFSREQSRGSTLSTPPSAGNAQQLAAAEATRKANQAAEQLAQAQRAHHQIVEQSQQKRQPQSAQSSSHGATPPSPRPASRSSTTVGRQLLTRERAQQQRQANAASTSAPPPTVPLNPAQQQQAQRNASIHAAQHAHEQEEQHQRDLLRQQQLREQQQRAAAMAKLKAVASKIDTSSLKGFDMKGVTGAPITPGRAIDPKNVMKPIMKAEAPAASSKPPQPHGSAPAPTSATPSHDDERLKPPQPIPPRGSSGRGF